MRIRTARLLLREFTLDDIRAFHALESRPEVVRFQTYEPRTNAQAQRLVGEIIHGQDEHPRRHTELAVCLDSVFIGRLGAWAEAEQTLLWYAFAPEFQGHGYATEAMAGFLAVLPRGRYVIECDPDNEPSWKLALRLGFELKSFRARAFESKGEWVGSMVYERTT